MALELVYDDDCGVCTASVKWLSAHASCVRPVAMTTEGLELDAVLAREARTDGTVVEHTGASAIAKVLQHADAPALRVVGWAMRAPGVRLVADAAYGVVSPRRAWLSERLGLQACPVPTPPTA